MPREWTLDTVVFCALPVHNSLNPRFALLTILGEVHLEEITIDRLRHFPEVSSIIHRSLVLAILNIVTYHSFRQFAVRMALPVAASKQGSGNRKQPKHSQK